MALCYAPFLHRMVETTGNYQLCCVAKEYDDGKYNDWEGEDYQKIRKHMIEEKELPDTCVTCKTKEEYNQYSFRHSFNQLYERLGSPSLDIQYGTAWEVPISFDLRMNNLCNLSCRMCGPSASTQLVKEAEKYPELWPKWADEAEDFKSNKFDVNYIIENAGAIGDLRLLGGEPSVQPEAKAILKELIRIGNTGIGLHITTNGTNSNKEFYDMISKFNRVLIVVSIDSWGKHHEYIRGPAAHFPTIWKNLNKLKSLPNNPKVMIQQTVTALNIFDFWRLRKNNDSGCELMSNLATWPDKYSPINMPDRWKQRAIEIAKENNGYEDNRHIFGQMMKKGNPDHLIGISKYTELMDSVRGQRLIDYFPTTHEMFEDIG